MPNWHRRWRYHGLKRPKIRQDWNKYNLYNLWKFRSTVKYHRTFFQQKWAAKAATRAYHGEQIMEKKWQRMFDKRLPAVVPQSALDMAEDDGSKWGAGRGSGLEKDPRPNAALRRRQEGERDEKIVATPYMQMVYFPTERRLDTAIFRSLFASSTRQARQLVVHGHVKVNGKRMLYPGYLLNPGDLFQVEPHMVLQCTGTITNGKGTKIRFNKKKSVTSETSEVKALDDSPAESAVEAEAEAEDFEDEPLTEEEAKVDEADESAALKKGILALRNRADAFEKEPPKGVKISAKKKIELRALRKQLKTALSKVKTFDQAGLDAFTAEFETLEKAIVSAQEPAKESPSSENTKPKPAPQTAKGKKAAASKESSAIPEAQAGHNWTPKDYMPAFAYIPRYLEVNQRVCSAVFLRDPVARPGFAEIPTPFAPDVNQLAFNWYLRRR